MIQDTLKNWRLYIPDSSLLAVAFQYLENFDTSTPLGEYNIQGEDVIAIVQAYDTRPLEKCRFETHRKHMDIQYIFEGGEGIGWTPLQGLELTESFDESEDKGFYNTPKRYQILNLFPEHFCLLMPEDAHQPCMRIEGFKHVRKVTMKIRYDGGAIV